MYKSPIEIYYEQLKTKMEGDIVKAAQGYNIKVDKEELIKALAYDRGQYDAGYRDAMASIVRCKDCVYYKTDTDYCRENNKGYCVFDSVIKPKNHFCGYGDRKDGADE